MNNTERFFVECVKKGIKDEKVETFPENIDYKQLYDLCISHSMSVVVFYALERLHARLHAQFLSALQRSVRRQIMRDVQSEYDVDTVLSALEEKGLKYMPLKGYHLKKLYPATEMRYASDCDVLIDVAEIKKVRELVDELGLQTKRHDEHHDIVYYQETKTVFELHKSIFVGPLDKYFGAGFALGQVKDGYSYFYEMSPEIFYMSILGHSAYHFAESAGVGIRHLADVYLFRKAHALNEEYLNNELEKCGLLQFKVQFEKLADYFFEDNEADEFTLKLADHILESSLLANEKKQSASDVASNSAQGDAKAKKRTIWRLLFPKKENMQFSYPILKKAVWLMPLFYFVRWVHVLFTRPKQIAKLKAIKKANEEEIKHMKEIRFGLGIENL